MLPLTQHYFDQLDFNLQFSLLRLLQFLSDLKGTNIFLIFCFGLLNLTH